MDELRRIADAVLYEGYVLWPYRRSATKNRQRWTFGGVFPPAHSAEHPDDRSFVRAECLVTEPEVDVTVRFLQVVHRQCMLRGEPVDEVVARGERHLSWDEAVEREAGLGCLHIGAGTSEERLDRDSSIVRSWNELKGTVEIVLQQVGELYRFAVVVHNVTPWHGDSRDDALRHAFCSTHLVLRSPGEFVSMTDPVAAACRNVGCWPVLVGDAHTMLAAPIILSDYPEIAPESPGDLFDATEIDRLLIANVLAMTPEEQEEMRATDPRAREILERCASLSRDELLRLHGVMR